MESNDRSGTLMEYPQPSAVEERLKQFAIEVGDATLQPFRVDLVRVHGGKPPIYCVVIRSFAKRTASAKTGAASKSFGEQELQAVAPWHAELRKRTAFQSRPVASMTDGSA